MIFIYNKVVKVKTLLLASTLHFTIEMSNFTRLYVGVDPEYKGP